MMSTLEERVTALEAKVEQLHLFDQMTSRIVEVVQQTGRDSMRAVADLGEQHDQFEVYVRQEITALNEKFDAHTVLLHRILKRLGDEE